MLALKVINFTIQLSVLRRVPVESHWYRSQLRRVWHHVAPPTPCTIVVGNNKAPRRESSIIASKKRLLRDAYGCATPLRDSVRDRPKALLSYAI